MRLCSGLIRLNATAHDSSHKRPDIRMHSIGQSAFNRYYKLELQACKQLTTATTRLLRPPICDTPHGRHRRVQP